MTDTPPISWRVLAVPVNWDPADPQQLNMIRDVQIDYVTVPDDFVMVIQTQDMLGAVEPTAIIVNFRASRREGVTLTRITGVGAHWENYLGEVVRGFPPTGWAKHAEGLIVDFLRLPEKREAVSAPISELPPRQLEVRDSAPSLGVGVQRRRKITPEHLQEVAKIYTAAQASDDPPTQAVRVRFAVSHSTAAKWVGAARRAGFLPPHGSDE